MEATDGYEAEIARLRYGLASLRLDTSLLRVLLRLKAGFRPDQPRVPAGNEDGGQWVQEDGSERTRDGDQSAASGGRLEKPILIGGRRSGGQVRIGNRMLPATPAQQTRLAVTNLAMKNSIRSAQRLNPKWRPRPQAVETVEGQIRANEANRLESELYIYQLTGRPPTLGPFAREWLPNPPLGQNLTSKQRTQLDALGRKYGCHGCGSKTGLTPKGHSVGDHQMPWALGKPSRILPHCIFCSSSQGGLISALRRRMGNER